MKPVRRSTLLIMSLAIVLLIGGSFLLVQMRHSVSSITAGPDGFSGMGSMAQIQSPTGNTSTSSLDRTLERQPASTAETGASTSAEVSNAPVEVARLPTGSKENWLGEHDRQSVAELIKERDSFRDVLDEEARPEFQKRFDAGNTTFVSAEHDYSVTPEDFSEISSIRMVPGKGTFRTVLPRSEYPGLYELKAQIDWYTDLIHQKSGR